MPPAQVLRLRSRLLFLQDANDLLFREPALPHRRSPLDRLNYQMEGIPGAGQSGDLLLGIGVPLLCVYIQGYFEFEFLEPIVQYMFALHLGMVAGLAHRKPQARDIPPRLRAGSQVAPQMP